MKIVGSKRQRGFSLVVVLVLLIVMSVLGVAVLRSSAMQERMTANLRDRDLALQAAEAALLFARTQLGVVTTVSNPTNRAWSTLVPSTDHCTSALGICPTGSAGPAGGWPAGPTIGAAAGDGLPTTTTDYWIEYIGTGPATPDACNRVNKGMPGNECYSPIFRITARSRAAGRADVTLQSNVMFKLPAL